MNIRHIDHIGIIVNDLPAAKAFFLDLGLELAGEGDVEGEWADRVIGLRNMRSSLAMLRTPGGETKIELAQFHSPPSDQQPTLPASNTLGIRHLAFLVEDLEGILANVKKHGAELVGEIQTYKDIYKVCYLRGPEGIILELAEQLK